MHSYFSDSVQQQAFIKYFHSLPDVSKRIEHNKQYIILRRNYYLCINNSTLIILIY